MARVTVGIPVYNGAPMLRECLDSLLAQTYVDFLIIISDNGSTDNTPDICAEYAARDNRIEVIRHQENVGPLPNFKYLVDRANTEFFMWRADDDYSDRNFLEKLVETHDRNPNAQLAVPRIVTRMNETEFGPEFPFIEISDDTYIKRLLKRFYLYHASWYYGLWRTKYIQETCSRVWGAYPEAYAGDHLTLLSALLDESVVGSNDTLFVQRTYSPVKGDGMRGRRSLKDRITLLERLMPIFYACYDAEIRRRNLHLDEERRLLTERRRFTYNKLRASPWRIFRLKVKRILGKKY